MAQVATRFLNALNDKHWFCPGRRWQLPPRLLAIGPTQLNIQRPHEHSFYVEIDVVELQDKENRAGFLSGTKDTVISKQNLWGRVPLWGVNPGIWDKGPAACHVEGRRWNSRILGLHR